jgi:hypothetical protein
MSTDPFFRSDLQSLNMPFGILSSENQSLMRLFALQEAFWLLEV